MVYQKFWRIAVYRQCAGQCRHGLATGVRVPGCVRTWSHGHGWIIAGHGTHAPAHSAMNASFEWPMKEQVFQTWMDCWAAASCGLACEMWPASSCCCSNSSWYFCSRWRHWHCSFWSLESLIMVLSLSSLQNTLLTLSEQSLVTISGWGQRTRGCCYHTWCRISTLATLPHGLLITIFSCISCSFQ